MKVLTQDKLAIMDVYAYDIAIYRDRKPVGDFDIVPADEYVTIVATNEIAIPRKQKRLGIYPYHVAKEIMLEIAIAMFEEETEAYCMPEDNAVSSCEELEKLLEKAEKEIKNAKDCLFEESDEDKLVKSIMAFIAG